MRYNHLLLFSAVIITAAVLFSCGPKYEFNLDEHLGICGTNRAEAAKEAGLDYLEANVSSFLMPEQSDEEFAANKAKQAQWDRFIKKNRLDDAGLSLSAAVRHIREYLSSLGVI